MENESVKFMLLQGQSGNRAHIHLDFFPNLNKKNPISYQDTFLLSHKIQLLVPLLCAQLT